MPIRATTSTEVMEMEESQHGTLGLQFNEPLSWTAGKPIAVGDLLRRLQNLSKEMRTMEQEENGRDSFTSVAKQLASPNLLSHKDKGIKAWTACCLVDILRLCAPDAPYTGQQLKVGREGLKQLSDKDIPNNIQDIFNLLITAILPSLSDPSNAYNQQHLYVLNSLAQVKSIVLLTDIPSSDSLMIHLFTSFFDILAGSAKTSTGEQLGKNVELNMTSILVTMVDESATLSSDIIDIIVAQFLRTDPRSLTGHVGKNKKKYVAIDEKQSTLIMKELPPAYNMAKTICNTCPEKMTRYVSQYFNDVIVDASSSSTTKSTSKKVSHRRHSGDGDNSDLDTAGGPTEEDLRELRKVHLLLRELWRACPSVLQNVIPQLEAELSAEDVHLRSLATETFGDIISGVGAAGLSLPPAPDHAAYPPASLSQTSDSVANQNVLTKASSPQPFPQAHPQAYASFLGRSHDKSASIRSAWVTGVGQILITAAGGVGLSQQEEDRLIQDLARMLGDADEKVRIAAVKVVGRFGFPKVVLQLGSSGGLDKAGTVLATLAERVRDRKHSVRGEAMKVLARLWGVAIGEIAAGEERVISALGSAPSKILDTYYTNDMEINALLDHVLFEQLLPLQYPPVKAKTMKLTNGTQKGKESKTNGEIDIESVDPDKIRVERILLLLRDLDEKAKKVFFSFQMRQEKLAKVMAMYLQRCEDFNGGVMDANEKAIKEHMTRLIDSFAKQLPDPSRATEMLWKFAKMHDRRSYTLIRFCMSPESDYRTVVKAIKEFTKRIEQSITVPQDMLDVFIPLVYRSSILIYNKSHVPAVMEYSRTDEKTLASTAHEMLQEISTHKPEVLKARIKELCSSIQDQAPTANKANEPSAVDNLKACASFASKNGKDIPPDRRFIQAMTNFALFGTPAESAKHAVTIVMAASNKQEMIANDLVNKCVQGFEYGGGGFLSRLATLSQLMLLAPDQVNKQSDEVSAIAIEEILTQVRMPAKESTENYTWSTNTDPECEAKCWALKIIVNRIRSHSESDTLAELAKPVYKVLSNLISLNGEVSPSSSTPSHHKSRLRLLAARLCLKLCTKKPTDVLFTAIDFNALALVAQDSILAVRSSFLQRLKKYLSQQRLPQRFYTIPFLLAFEPNDSLKSDTITWIRSRASTFYALRTQRPSSKASIVMESVFARLLSLLAHHPDYDSAAEDLVDFARYILFYLNSVANEDNLSLIYHIAQRVKQSRDVINAAIGYDDNLYHLSDLAQLTIRKFEDAHGWNIQTYPGKARLPTNLFSELQDHDEAQRIAEKHYLSEAVEEGVEALVRASMKAARLTGKKRKSEVQENGDERGIKRAKSLAIRKGPTKEKKPKAPISSKMLKKTKRKSDESTVPSSERRRSGRATVTGGQYAERDDEEDDEEMAEGVASWKYEDGDVVVNGGDREEVGGEEEEEDGGRDNLPDELGMDREGTNEEELTPKRTPTKGKKNKKASTGVSKARKKGSRGR